MPDPDPVFNSLSLAANEQDVTDLFFQLHRTEILSRPNYKRLIIGTIKGENSRIVDRRQSGSPTLTVPYAEPTWLTPGYFSPYYNEVSGVRQLSDVLVAHFVALEPSKASEISAEIC